MPFSIRPIGLTFKKQLTSFTQPWFEKLKQIAFVLMQNE